DQLRLVIDTVPACAAATTSPTACSRSSGTESTTWRSPEGPKSSAGAGAVTTVTSDNARRVTPVPSVIQTSTTEPGRTLPGIATAGAQTANSTWPLRS